MFKRLECLHIHPGTAVKDPDLEKNFGRSVLVLHSDRRPLRPKRIPPDTGLPRNGAAEAGRVWRSLLGLPGLSTSWWDAVRYGSSTKQNTPHGRQHETAPRSANARKLMRTYTNVCQSYVTWCKLVIFAWQSLHTKTEVTSLRFASQKCLRLRFAVQKIRVPRLTVLCAPSLNMRKKENIVFEKTRMHGLAKKKGEQLEWVSNLIWIIRIWSRNKSSRRCKCTM